MNLARDTGAWRHVPRGAEGPAGRDRHHQRGGDAVPQNPLQGTKTTR